MHYFYGITERVSEIQSQEAAKTEIINTSTPALTEREINIGNWYATFPYKNPLLKGEFEFCGIKIYHVNKFRMGEKGYHEDCEKSKAQFKMIGMVVTAGLYVAIQAIGYALSQYK